MRRVKCTPRKGKLGSGTGEMRLRASWRRSGRRIQSRQLLLGGGDDDLAAAVGGDAALGAEGVDLAVALHAQARLERAGRVVDARVDHPAVMAALVLGDGRLFVQDGQPETWVALQ